MRVLAVLLALSLPASQAGAQLRAVPVAVRPGAPVTGVVAPLRLGSGLGTLSSPNLPPLSPALVPPQPATPRIHAPIAARAAAMAEPVSIAVPRVGPVRPATGNRTNRTSDPKSQLEETAKALSPRSAPLALNAVFDGAAKPPGGGAEPSPVSEGGALPAPTRLSRAPHGRDAEGRPVPPPSGLRSLIRTHYFGVLHDSAFKTFLAAWVTASMSAPEAGTFVSMATAAFTLPYLLFSTWAGRLADRGDKPRLIARLKVVELGLAAAGALTLALGSPWGALAVLAALGTRSALMSPAKYAMLAERVPEEKLAGANGWLELSTFLSLIAGTALGGALAAWGAGAWASAAFGLTAALGWRASLSLRGRADAPRPPARSAKVRMPAKLVWTSVAIASFWLLSSLVQMNIFLFGPQTLGVGTGVVTAMLTVMGVATGVGAMAAGKLSKDRVELGLVPIGAAGVALFLLDLGLFGAGSVVRAFVDLAGLSVAAGLFYIPLNAFLQKESPPEARGRFLGLSNLMTFAAILVSAGLYWLLSAALALSPAAVFTAAAAAAVASALPVLWVLRGALAGLLRRKKTAR